MARPAGHGPGFEARRLEIIDQAASLYAERGYAATGITELGTAVGLGKGALYRYIGSKEALLVEIQDRVVGPLLASAEVIQRLDQPALTRLRLVSRLLLETIVERLDHIRVYEHDYRLLSEPHRGRVLAQRHRFELVVRSLLEEAMTEGDIDQQDPELAMLQFLNLHNYTYQWARTDSGRTPEQLSAAFFGTLARGFGASSRALARTEKAAGAAWAELGLP